ncbi:hypothetical protein C8F01DRAFT_100643 [Mycena amicta]|nr:hypothetical protein C8F01DRAFT_100643 [Mycena amicta]
MSPTEPSQAPQCTRHASAQPPSDVAQDSRVQELWFKDGTLVIKAENLLFRVYGGLLAKVSPIFESMLEFPQPAEEETIDGCPVVELHDTAQDAKCFLQALFDYRFFLPPPERTDWRIVCGVMRLSKKYDVEELSVRALKHLSTAFVMDLDQYPGNPTFDLNPMGLTHLVRLGRELSIHWFLPAAFYQLCSVAPIGDIVSGVTEGTEHVELSLNDKVLCARGIVNMRLEAGSKICDFLWDPATVPGCSRPKRCAESRISLRRQVESWRINGNGNGTFPLTLWECTDWSRLSVCDACLGAAKLTHAEALCGFWRSLPTKFALQGWDALKRERREDLGGGSPGDECERIRSMGE